MSDPRVKVGIVCALAVVALAVGWFMVISPKRSEAAKLGTQIEETRTKIAVAQGASDGSGPAPANPIRVADLFKLSRAMPDKADIPSVLLQLSQISNETGVAFQSITPHDPIAVGDYQQIGIDLVFEGHFYDLSDFLYRLRNLVGVHQGVLDSTGRLFSVDSVSFNEGELKFPQVKAALTVSAYVYGDGLQDPLPAGATGGGTEAAPGLAPINSAQQAADAAEQAQDERGAGATDSAQPIPANPSGA